MFQKHMLRIYLMWDTSTHKSQGDSNFFDSRQILFETRNVARTGSKLVGFLRKRREMEISKHLKKDRKAVARRQKYEDGLCLARLFEFADFLMAF